MSSTGAFKRDGTKTERNESDLYETPSWCIDILLQQEEIFAKFPYGNLFEPCAGNGAIIKAVNAFSAGKNFYDWTAVEILPECESNLNESLLTRPGSNTLVCPQDYLTYEPVKKFDGIITNPPFFIWEECLKKSLREADVVIYLLRLGVLGSKKRHPFWQIHKPAIYIMSQRPSFTPNGKTDSDYYIWAVFGAGVPGSWKVI
jgi:hypothetical protein